MPIIQITARDDQLETAFSDRPAAETLREAARATPPDAPVLFFIHGFLYDPTASAGSSLDRRRHPHRLVLSKTADRRGPRRSSRFASWPAALGFAGPDPRAGLAVGFGWNSFPRPLVSLRKSGRSGFAQAYEAAETAATALAAALRCVAAARPRGRIDLFAHSLGARVGFLALRQAHREGWSHRLGRILALGAAEYQSEARAAATCCGPDGPSVINYLARQNDAFDHLLEVFGPKPYGAPQSTPLGADGLGRPAPGWLDLQLDHPATEAWLRGQGVALGPRRSPICHWSFYTRPGVAGWHRRVIDARWSASDLVRMGAPTELEPRWSRFRLSVSAPLAALTRPPRPRLPAAP